MSASSDVHSDSLRRVFCVLFFLSSLQLFTQGQCIDVIVNKKIICAHEIFSSFSLLFSCLFLFSSIVFSHNHNKRA